MREREMGVVSSSMWKAAAVTAVFGPVHSALASRAAKEGVARVLGRRNRNGLYRAFFVTQSLLTFAGLIAYLLRLPDRTLYRVRGLAARLMNAGQLAGLAGVAYTATQVGLGGMLGLTSLRAWLADEGQVPAEPEAQGPRRDAGGALRVAGPFRWSRHPLNLFPLAVLWLFPHMTARLLAFNAVATAYLYLGSLHEEQRLRAAYGRVYQAYQEGGTPFYLP